MKKKLIMFGLGFWVGSLVINVFILMYHFYKVVLFNTPISNDSVAATLVLILINILGVSTFGFLLEEENGEIR